MEFVPSDYLTLGAVVIGVVEAEHASLLADFRSHTAELERMTAVLTKARRKAAAVGGEVHIADWWSRRRQTLCRTVHEERLRVRAAHDDAIDRVCQALGDGALPWWVLSDHGFLSPGLVEPWRAFGGRQAVVAGRVSDGRAMIKRADFERWSQGPVTVSDERRLLRYLTDEMAAAPAKPVPKPVMMQRARSAGHVFSDIGFKRIWKQAAMAANAPRWSKGGRRDSQISIT